MDATTDWTALPPLCLQVRRWRTLSRVVCERSLQALWVLANASSEAHTPQQSNAAWLAFAVAR
jgi:hypothetical protein